MVEPAGEAVDGDMEGGLKAEVISWCCIDWPSFNNVVRLRLRKVQDALKDQATDRYTFPPPQSVWYVVLIHSRPYNNSQVFQPMLGTY